jgi:hypothetical protein
LGKVTLAKIVSVENHFPGTNGLAYFAGASKAEEKVIRSMFIER